MCLLKVCRDCSHRRSVGKLFHTAVLVSHNLRTIFIVLCMFGTSEGNALDLRGLVGVYDTMQLSISQIYAGVIPCSVLNVSTKSLDWHLLNTSSQCSSRSTFVIG